MARKPRLWRIRGLVLASHPDQSPQLDERLVSDLPHRLEMDARLGGLTFEKLLGSAGLRGDDRDRVRDDIVQFASHARPLCRDGFARERGDEGPGVLQLLGLRRMSQPAAQAISIMNPAGA